MASIISADNRPCYRTPEGAADFFRSPHNLLFLVTYDSLIGEPPPIQPCVFFRKFLSFFQCHDSNSLNPLM